MKKLFLVITIFCILLTSGCVQTSKEDDKQQEIVEGKYPTRWDGSVIYNDESEIQADFDALEDWLVEIESYKGKLNTVEGLLGYIQSQYSVEYITIYDRINAYCGFGSSVFPLETKYTKYVNDFNEFNTRLNNTLAFADEEMMNIPYDKRIELFSDEKINKYASLYSKYLYEDYIVSDSDISEVYNIATMSHGRIRDTYINFIDIEIPDAEYKTEKGDILKVDQGTLSDYIYGDYSIEEKNKIYDAWFGNVAQYKNTLTSLLETYMLEQYSNATLNGFDEVKNVKLYDLGFEDDIIQKIIDFAHKYSDIQKECFSLYADENGEYTYISNENTISDYKTEYVNYDDAVDEVLAALSPLGEEYQKEALEMFTNGHIDVYPADNKVTGAFEMGSYVGLYPFIMYNYTGTYEDVSDLAHEMGHACYDILTEKNQEMYNWLMPPFIQEVASTTNEVLYYEYKIQNAQSDEEKEYFIEKFINKWVTTVFSTCMWQEFEDCCYKIIENGDSLSVDVLTEKWEELSKEYYGDNLSFEDNMQYRWLSLKCLYNNYYEFSYATSLCYATVIANNILNNVPEAKENYLDFLKTGSSVLPAEALNIAGIDIYDDKIYDQAFEILEKYFEEMKNFS